MKILIFNPPRKDGVIMVKEGRCMQRKDAWCYVMSPVTMVTLATMLRSDGNEVRVMDAAGGGQSFSEAIGDACRFRPDLTLINTSTPTIDDDVAAARALKEGCGPDVMTALYGIHVSVLYRDLLKPGNGVDACLIGEPEWTAREIARALSADRDFEAVRGLARLGPSGEIRYTGAGEPAGELDELPTPDWSFVNTDLYRLPFTNEKFLLVNTSRGCPHHCTFCNAHVYYGRSHRRRSVGHLMRELRSNVDRFGVTHFLFWAEEFILDRVYVREVCNAIIDSGLNISWACNSRVDGVDEEILSLVRRAGCWNIAFGIESGVPEVLAGTRKNITIEQTSRAVALAKKCGLAVTGHVILGLPEDNEETMERTQRFVEGLDLDFVQYYCAMPYPGTRLYEDAVRGGWIRAANWSHWEHNVSVLDYPRLKSRDVMRTRRKFLTRFYFRPKTAAKMLGTAVRSPGGFQTLVRNAREFLRWM